MATKTKRINRHRLAVIQVYGIIAVILAVGFGIGFLTGRHTAPVETKTVTVTETVEVPAGSGLPEVEEVAYFDVPLSHSLQRYIYEVCAEEEVPVCLVVAMIDNESKFDPETVSETDDYGLMQINAVNHAQLEEDYRCADMLDPYQNVFCGIKIIGSYLKAYDGDYAKALMAYNMGEYGAKKAWDGGIYSTPYTERTMELWKQYEGGEG